MDKVTKFLERHVQWLVLGLAALYVGYTVYAYIVVPPLQIAMAPNAKPALPATIDDEIKTLQADPLDAEMSKTVVNAPPVTDIEKEFHDRLNMKKAPISDLAVRWDAPSVPPGLERPNAPTVPGTKIVALPSLPPATVDSMTSSRTVIMAPGRKDSAYASIRFKINNAALMTAVNAAFAKPGIPPVPSSEFVTVQLYREEQKPDGTWDKAITISPLPLYVFEPLPKADAKLEDFFKYQHWMDANQAQIQSPAFFKTAADAEPWRNPGAPAPAVGPRGGPAFVPRAGVGGQAPAYNPAAPGVSTPAPGGTPDPTLPAGLNPVAGPNGALNPFNPGNTQDLQILCHDVTMEKGKTYRYAVRYRLFNPFFNNKSYAVPAVYQQFFIEGPDPLLDKDPKSVAWTGPTTVEPDTYVFVTKIKSYNSQAEFDIFEWKDGHWHETPPKADMTVGDLISGQMGVSRFTLVDVRKDTRQKEPEYVIVMDADGTLDSRTVQDDSTKEKYQTLKAQITPATAAR